MSLYHHEVAELIGLPTAHFVVLPDDVLAGKRCACCPARLETAPRMRRIVTVSAAPGGPRIEKTTDVCSSCFAAALREYGFQAGQASRSAFVPMAVAGFAGLVLGLVLAASAVAFLTP